MVESKSVEKHEKINGLGLVECMVEGKSVEQTMDNQWFRLG